MTEFEREIELIPKLTEWDQEKKFYDEVPLFKKMMDLYAVQVAGESTFAYELKLKNWRTGLSQATHYLLAADYVYLVVPKSISHRVTEGASDVLESVGIGLLAVDGSVEEVVQPRRSGRVMDRCRKETIFYLKGRKSLEAGTNAV